MNDDEMLRFCKSIIAADKTNSYPYTSERRIVGSELNADGKAPPIGSKWLTPMELATEKMREIIMRQQNERCKK